MSKKVLFRGKFKFNQPLTTQQKEILRTSLREKTGDCYDWLEGAIESYLKPWGIVINGCVDYEDGDDRGILEVVNNNVLPF